MRAWKWIILLGLACFCLGCSYTERHVNDERAYSDPEAQKTKAFFDGVSDVLYGHD